MLLHKLFRIFTLWAGWLLLIVPGLQAAQTAHAQSWDAEHFAMTPSELIEAFSDIKSSKSSGVILLLKQTRYTFDDQGRSVSNHYLLYKVTSPAAVDKWSRTEQVWSPWHQERPNFRARVIGEDGVEFKLDPNTVAAAPVAVISPDIYSDRQMLRAPLPGVNVNSIVEEEIIIREKRPLYAEGIVRYFPFVSEGPVQLARLILEAPPSLPLRYVTRQLPSMTPQITETRQQVRWIFESGPMDPYEAPEPGLPSSVPPYPYVAFSTGDSWKKLAAYYSSIVEEQIRDANLDSLVREIIDESTDRKTVSEKLLYWIQTNIRYTGLRFGQAPIAPMKPAETLAHKYGDCKDKSALLTAMLRAAGIPAFVALLKSGPGPEVESDLPGLSAFDHAVVYMPGNPPLWTDPTHDFARIGELPAADQDRLAMIADSSTANLVRTPAAEAEDNLVLEAREFFLSDIGSSRVIETTEWHGENERAIRYAYRDSEKKEDLQLDLNSYAEQTYLSKDDVKFEHSDPKDLSRPFKLRLEVSSAERGTTIENEAVVAIRYETIAELLPWEFWFRDEQMEAGEKPNGIEKRKHDYVFEQPFVNEWHYRVVPPPGFRLNTLPENETILLGTAKFSKEFAVSEDGVATARLRFDSGKRQISSSQFQEMRTALTQFAESEPILIKYSQIGMEHLAAGRIREAIDEFNKLQTLYPQKAHYRCLMAKALMEAGLGDAARKSARAAVEMEPGSPYAYKTLGFVLQHDSIGRMFKQGFDYDGALAAYKKAKELDPDSAETIVSLAILLEHDKDGNRYSGGSRLSEAIEEYHSLSEDARNQYAQYLMMALMEGHRFAELKEVSEEFKETSLGKQMLILATAMTENSKAAIDVGNNLFSLQEPRRQAYEVVGHTLSRLRLYPEASDLLREAAKGAANSIQIRALAEMRLKTRRYESFDLPDDDPRTVAKKLIISLFVPHENKRYPFSSLFAPELAEEIKEIEEAMRYMQAGLRIVAEKSGISMEIIADSMLSNIKIRMRGDDTLGYIIQFGGFGPMNLDVLVIKENNCYKILGAFEEYQAIGKMALKRIRNLDEPGARQLLNWVRELVPSPGVDDPFEGNPFPKVWPLGSAGEESRIRVAAASLMAGGIFSEQAEQELLDARDASASEVDQASIDHALALAYKHLKRYEDLLTVANRLYKSNPKSRSAFLLYAQGLLGLNRYSDVRRLAEERIKIFHDDPASIRILASTAIEQEDWEEADGLLRRLVNSGRAEANDYNDLAWLALFWGNVTQQSFEDARNAVAGGKQFSAPYLHTLASLYAEDGKTMEAREAILESIDASGKDEPGPDDWYVFGRIAENFDLPDVAASAYMKVKDKGPHELKVTSTYRLAQKRLEGLHNR